MNDPIVSDAVIRAELATPTSGLAAYLTLIAQTKVVPDAHEALRRDAPMEFIDGRWRWRENKPPGPPMRRVGVLDDSVQVQQPQFDADGELTVAVTVSAYHESFKYSQRLQERGYKFVFDKDYYLWSVF